MRKRLAENLIILSVMVMLLFVFSLGVSAKENISGTYSSDESMNSGADAEEIPAENGFERYLSDASVKTVNVKLSYDDVYNLNRLFAGYVIADIRTVNVRSFKVSRGIRTENFDDSVVSEYRDKSAFIADGVGKASVYIVKSEEEQLYETGEATSVIKLSVSVEPAVLSVVYEAGQSNLEGTSKDYESKPENSVVCDRFQVYSAYAPSSDSRAKMYTGLENNYSSINREDEFIPGNLCNSEEILSVAGNELVYPVYALSSDGLGKTGPDSGFAYQWNKLSGEKVFIINSAYAGTRITHWAQGGIAYTHALAAFKNAKKTYDAELDSGHFKKGRSIFLFMQGENYASAEADTYKKYFDQCVEPFQQELGFDHVGLIMPRVILNDYGTDYRTLRLTGARSYQSYIARQTDNNIIMASTVNEKWITDAGVSGYFSDTYGTRVSYMLRDSSDIRSLPDKVSQIHDGIHFSQIAHNENGIDSADNLYYAINGIKTYPDYSWLDGDGNRLEITKTLQMSMGEVFPLSLRPSSAYEIKGITYEVDEQYMIQCEDEDAFLPLNPGKTYIKVYKDGALQFVQDVEIFIGTPRITSVKVEKNGMRISWDEPLGNPEYYRLFYKKGSSWKGITVTSDTSYLYTSVKFGETYTFTVRCVDKDGNFISKYDPQGFTATYYFETPKITSVSNSNGVKIVWNKVEGADYYRLFYKNGKSWKGITTVKGSSYIWKKAELGTAYVFTVRAVTKDGEFTSSYDKNGYSFTYYLSTPVLKTAQMSNGDIKVSWSSVPNGEKYRLFYKGGEQTSWKTVTTTSSLSSVFDLGTYNTEYTFTVRCVNDKGTFISDYDKNGISCLNKVKTPLIGSVRADGTSAVFSWSKVTGAGKYRLFYKNGSGWKALATVNGTSYTWKDITVYKKYVFTVRCVNSKGSFISDYDTDGYEYILKLGTPKLKSVTKKSPTSVTLTWDTVNNAELYKVFYKTQDTDSWKVLGVTSDISYDINSLKTGKEYTFTVRCIDSKGNFTSDYDNNGISIIL